MIRFRVLDRWKKIEYKVSVVEMEMFRWMSRVTKKHDLRDEH